MVERPAQIPHESGVYLFRDARGGVLYVGKALSLNQRLGSYFQRPDGPAHQMFKVQALVAEATAVEWIVTNSEVDALFLENELIKTHQPRYNARLKDDKSFPYLALDFRSPYAHPYVTRGPHHAQVTYFGPFAHVKPLRRTIDELLQAFPLRSCSDAKFADHQRRGRPCLMYDVGKCCGPCVGRVSDEEYDRLVREFGAFFDGRVAELRHRLEDQMAHAAADRRYEVAARARDGLVALERAATSQRVVLDRSTDLDCVAVTHDGPRASVVQHRVRGGRVVGRNALLVDLAIEQSPADTLAQALPLLFPTAEEIPRVVLVDEGVGVATIVGEYLSTVAGRPVLVRVPRRGRRKQLLELVQTDGAGVLADDAVRRAHDHNRRSRALQELGAALGLDQPPYRIECFDMSHLQGTSYVGSMVVFEDGLPKKSAYRRFHVRSVLGNDDVGAMREVLGRRFAHWSDETPDRKFAPADLVIVDGGVPQLHAAMAAAAEAGVTVELAALAKREELLFRPDSPLPIALERGSEGLYLVQRLRDEAHRFAITFHRSKRGRAMVASALDGVRGLGPQRQARLLERLGSLADVQRATREELSTKGGLPEAVASALYDHLHAGAAPRLAKERG